MRLELSPQSQAFRELLSAEMGKNSLADADDGGEKVLGRPDAVADRSCL